MRASSEPLVVSVTSRMPGTAASRAISSSTPRRTSGSPPVMRSFSTPIAGEHARQALDLLERQQLLAAQELELLAEDLLRHAVDAAEVAAVGDRDAQIPHGPGELVEGDGHQLQYCAARSSLVDMAIAVGQRAVQEFPVDDRTIELFGEASTDRNPLHFDDEFARGDAVRRPHRARHDHRGLHLGDDRQRAARARLGLPRRRRSSSARRCGPATSCASRSRCSSTTRSGAARGSRRARSSATRSSWTARRRSSHPPDGAPARRRCRGRERRARAAAGCRAGGARHAARRGRAGAHGRRRRAIACWCGCPSATSGCSRWARSTAWARWRCSVRS